MPWIRMTPKGTHKATAQALKELWAKFANESLERTGDEGRAIRQANAVVARRAEAGHQAERKRAGTSRYQQRAGYQQSVADGSAGRFFEYSIFSISYETKANNREMRLGAQERTRTSTAFTTGT